MLSKDELGRITAKIKHQQRPLLQGLAITLLAALASASLGASALGRFISSGTIDLLIRRTEPHKQKDVVLINITEDDYKDIFDRKRPLRPTTILTLAQAAITGGAKLVAIDIATEDWPIDTKLEQALAALGGSSTQLARVVWARNFVLQQSQTRGVYVMEPLLGGAPSAARECYGVPALAEEAGVVRWFSEGLEINSVYVPSLVQQILYRSEHNSCLQTVDSNELRLISFSAFVPSESASTLLFESTDKDWGRSLKPYHNAIVIIGGSFHEGGDIRLTPIGPRSGLDIVGEAVASALNGEARPEVGEAWSVVIDGTIGLLIVFLGLVSHRMQYWATAGAVLLAIVGMWFLWRQYYLFLSFVPILIGLVVHLALERALHRGGSTSHGHQTLPKAQPLS